MTSRSKVQPKHLARQAYVYVRQSSPGQVVSNPESARRQRELASLARELGWSPTRISVLDDDQATSGQSVQGREAYKLIAGEVSVGEVGIVIGMDTSRLARNNADWFPLIEMCALTGTLIADEEGVYDANDPNDRLLLGLKGTLSEAELQRMRMRLHGARWSLARRGELRRRLPGGYVWDSQGRVVMDPDERVRSALFTFFRRFDEEGSACALARAYERDGLMFPRRDPRGSWDAPVRWAPLGVRTANTSLHNPVFAGVYCYGRERAETVLDPESKARKTIMRLVPMESWEVLIRDHHPAYISWERFQRNQERLRENRSSSSSRGAVRPGEALLQGLVHCGRCGRKMGVRYSGRDSQPWYICARHTPTGRSQYCCGVAGRAVDGWVECKILEAIQPAGIAAAIAAVEELERRAGELRREWELQIEQAEYEAALARRRYEAVDPDNRLVAANLERDWEEKLGAVEELRRELAERERRPPMRIVPADRARLHELARDLPRLWREPTTILEDRKKVVRILVQDVWLMQEDEPRRTNVQIHWHTDAVTEGHVERQLAAPARFKTPLVVVSRAQELYAGGTPLAEIALRLNSEGFRTGPGNTFTAGRVQTLLGNRGMTTRRKAMRSDKRSGNRNEQRTTEEP